MKDQLPKYKEWAGKNTGIALARVIGTWGSSPRPIGSCMLISENMEMSGSVSGGCVETSVVKEALPLMKSGNGKLLSYGISNEDAWAVGLTCGGRLEVFLNDITDDALWLEMADHLLKDRSCIMISRLSETDCEHTLLFPDNGSKGSTLPNEVMEEAMSLYSKRIHGTFTWNQIEYFINVFPRRSQLLIIGAAHITSHLIDLASDFDFEVTVIDPRGVFATKTHFITQPDQIIEKYPSEVLQGLTLDSYTYAVVLSHDPKIDDDALKILLRSKVSYIGALGSKKNHEKRKLRLGVAGFNQEEISRIEAPIGMDINAKGAKEIALSIMASIIQTKNKFQ